MRVDVLGIPVLIAPLMNEKGMSFIPFVAYLKAYPVGFDDELQRMMLDMGERLKADMERETGMTGFRVTKEFPI